jgi:hypothetical protein
MLLWAFRSNAVLVCSFFNSIFERYFMTTEDTIVPHHCVKTDKTHHLLFNPVIHQGVEKKAGAWFLTFTDRNDLPISCRCPICGEPLEV